MAGIELINSLKNLGMTIRNEIDFYHDNWYHQAISLAGKVGIEEWMPRTANRQTTRDNHPATNESEYYKRSITIPVIDHLNSALQARRLKVHIHQEIEPEVNSIIDKFSAGNRRMDLI